MRRWLVALLGLVLLGACTSPTSSSPTVDDAFRGIELPEPYVIPAVTLTDTAGQPFTVTTSPTRPVRVLFFGYTHCPDICPGVLADIAAALNRVPDNVRDQVQVIFITTDPPRDSPSVIRSYLDRFDPDFTGLTGSMDSITTLGDAVGIAIEGTHKLPDGGYEVDHTASLIGINRKGEGQVVWTVGTSLGDLSHDLERLVTQ